MSQNDKVCIELAFNNGHSYSRRMKVRDFWKYMDEARPLEPCVVKAEKLKPTKEKQKLPTCKRIWYNQFKLFKEHGLDKVALAAAEGCTLCSLKPDCRCPDFAGGQEESHEEQLESMKAFDERLEERSHANRCSTDQL